jgi:hypothetical protein
VHAALADGLDDGIVIPDRPCRPHRRLPGPVGAEPAQLDGGDLDAEIPIPGRKPAAHSIPLARMIDFLRTPTNVMK